MAIKNDFVVKHGLTVTNTATINQDLIVVGSIKKNGVNVGYGYTGSQGSIGYTGSQGIQGVTGYTGSQGIQGNIGYTGSQGIQGNIGYTGSQGAQGIAGYTGSQGAIGYTGSKGDSGLGFTIAKTYASVAALTADTTPTGIVAGQFALIETGDVENPENSRLYLWNGSSYQYTSDLSGAQGITGPQGVTGYTGSAGPSNLINSTGFDDSANHGFLYLVGVGETGVNSTASSLVSVPMGIDTANEALVVGGTAADKNSTLTVNSPYGQTQVSVVSPAGRRSSSGIKLKTGDSTSTDLIQYSGYFGIESLASPLFFAPGPGNNITLRNDGCVINSQGIDTTPLATLDVKGSLYTYGTATINQDLIVTGSIKKNGIDVGYGYTGSQGIQGVIGYTGSAGPSNVLNATAASTSSVQYFVGVPATGSNQTPNASTTVPVVFQPSTGNVGIGATPSVPLEVRKSATGSNVIQRVGISGQTKNPYLESKFDETNGVVTLNASGSAAPGFTFEIAQSEKMRIDSNGNINIPTLGARITGDFSNPTVSNRLMFQSSTANGNTLVGAVSNGTASSVGFYAFGGSDPSNVAYAGIASSNGVSNIVSGITGTGTYQPDNDDRRC